MNRAALFLLALAAYFATQAGLRIWLGGALEGDEAEMVVIARQWHFVAGSQPPLYNWYQTLGFALFGVGTAGIVLPKNILLFLTYATVFLALRPLAGLRKAMLGTLALALIPNLAWWAQRTGSHSIALVALTALTLAAFFHLLRRPSTRAFVLLGLAAGLGGLAKPNYWVLPPALLLAGFSLPVYRAILWDRRLWLSGAVTLAIVALPYATMLAAPQATFSDTWEFARGAAGAAARWPLGLARLGRQTLTELLPLALVAGLVALGRPALRQPQPFETLLLRAALIGLGLVAVGIVAADIAFVRARWLLPLFMMAVPAAVMILLTNASPRTTRNFGIGIAALAILLLGAMAETRLRGTGSHALRIDLLAQEIEALDPDTPPLLAHHYYAGNLLVLRPGWQALPPYPTQRLAGGGRVLAIESKPGQAATLLAEHGYTRPLPPSVPVEVSIPYRFDPAQTRPLRVILLEVPVH